MHATPCAGTWRPAARVVSVSSRNHVSGHSQCRRPVSSVMGGITLKLVYRIELFKKSFRKTELPSLFFLFSPAPTTVDGYPMAMRKEGPAGQTLRKLRSLRKSLVGQFLFLCGEISRVSVCLCMCIQMYMHAITYVSPVQRTTSCVIP